MSCKKCFDTGIALAGDGTELTCECDLPAPSAEAQVGWNPNRLNANRRNPDDPFYKEPELRPSLPEHGGWEDTAYDLQRKLRKALERERTLYDAIAHGDEQHRAWLKEAIDKHFGLTAAADAERKGEGKTT